MSTPSPIVQLNGAGAGLAVNVTGGSTVTGALASTAGANFFGVTIVSCDDQNTVAAITATLTVNTGAKTFSFTAPASAGSCVVIQIQVGVIGLGLDANGVVQSSFTTTTQINVLTTGGNAVLAVNERSEYDATFGWIKKINTAIRVPPTGSFGQTNLSLANGLNSNVNTGGLPVVRIGGPTAAFSIDGFVAPSATQPNRITVWNTTAYAMTIVDKGTSVSAAGNKIATVRSVNVTAVVRGGGSVDLVYDATLGAWVLTGSGYVAEPYYNAKDSGATGNGSTDDTSKLQAWLTAGAGGIARIPAGTYLISSTLTVPINTIVMGDGKAVTIITKNTAGDAFLSSHTVNGSTLAQIALRGLTVTNTATVSPSNWLASSSSFTMGQLVQPFGTFSTLTGTVALTQGSSLVVGSGTSFTTALAVGQCVAVGSQTGRWIVQSITDNTHCQLATVFTGATTASTSMFSFPGHPASILLKCTATGTTGSIRPLGQLTWVSMFNIGYVANPAITMSGTPTTNCGVTIMIQSSTTFQWSLNGGQSWAASGVTIPNGSSTALGSTGLTAAFAAGTYTANTVACSPIFGWSLVTGTSIVDGTVTWQVVDGGAGFHDIGGTDITVEDCVFSGCTSGIRLDQSEVVNIRRTYCNASTSVGFAGIWIANGPGSIQTSNYSYCNDITLEKTNINGAFRSFVDDGGNAHHVRGGNWNAPGFELARIAGTNGLTVDGLYTNSPYAARLWHHDSQLQDLSAIYLANPALLPFVESNFSTKISGGSYSNTSPTTWDIGYVSGYGSANGLQLDAVYYAASFALVSGAALAAHVVDLGTSQGTGGGTVLDAVASDGTGVARNSFATITIATTGTTSLTPILQLAENIRVATVTLTGNATIDFGGMIGVKTLDVGSVTLSGHTLTIKNGAATVAITTLMSTKTLIQVVMGTTANIAAG